MRVPRLGSRSATAGLVALAVVDVVLVAMALQAGSASGEPLRPAADATVSSSPATSSSGATASASPSAGGSGTTGASSQHGGRLLLVAIDATHAWRAAGGTCDQGGATLERTADGGTTWQRVATPLSTITRLKATSATSAFVIGSDRSCKAQLRSTEDGGSTWSQAGGSVAQTWYLDPKSSVTVGVPGGQPTRPCGNGTAVQDLAVVDGSTARVLCANGSVRETVDSGASWRTIATVAGASALAVPKGDPSRTYAVRARTEGCAGSELVQLAQPVKPLSCAAVVGESENAADGPIALSANGTGAWLAAGANVLRSNDLRTWR